MMIAMLFCCSSSVQAAPGSDYTYSVTASKAQITKYKGAGGAVTIPSTLAGYPVTSIGDCAFGFTGITSITFNSATTTIYNDVYTIPATATIVGYDPSTAKAYAKKYGNPFQVIGTPTSATLQSITITTPATKLSYNIGDSLNIIGLVVTGTYSDGSTAPEAITAANVTGFNSTAVAANQVLTVTVNGKNVTYEVQIVAAPNTSGIGDLYDTTTMVHYSMSGIIETTKSNLAAAFANGDHFVKMQAGGKFLDYNSAYAEFTRLMSAGSSASNAIATVETDTTLQTTIDTSTFTEASSTAVNPFLVAPKFNIFEIDGTLDLTKATGVKATGTEGSVSGVVNITTGAFTINTASFATESVMVQAYDAQGNAVSNPITVVIM
jgi:hypothetical protein